MTAIRQVNDAYMTNIGECVEAGRFDIINSLRLRSVNLQYGSGAMTMKCDLQDYVEIACMFRYKIKVRLKTGEVIKGFAVTTRLNVERQELLVLASGKGMTTESATVELALDLFQEMEVLTESARFKRVSFV